MTARPGQRSLLAQPKAVWAVAFAAVVSFMGLGLVDPILPAIAHDLNASPSQVELLFTSYFAFTGVSMLVTSAVASRIGAKRTLLCGLVLIIIFSALAGSSDSIGAIVGLRAGWGLGNALFIATALSVIISSATGGVGGAVILYEAALGLGISVGPLLGGELGSISWRGPFFGVAVLMTIGLLATALLVPRAPRPDPSERISVLDPLRALRHRATRGSGVTALLYNFGFFTLLAYTPFPLGLGAHQLGYVFCGWGVLLAVFSVFVAPRVAGRFGHIRGLGGSLAGVVVLLLVMGVAHGSQTVLIVCIIGAGTVLGVTNTLITQVVMETAPVARPVASASYSFVRFTGGAVAPYLAGKLGEHVGVGVPFYVGAGMTVLSIVSLYAYRDVLTVRAGAARSDERDGTTIPAPALGRHAPILLAVGGAEAREVTGLAAEIALARETVVYLVHVAEHDVLAGEDVADLETSAAARQMLKTCIAELRGLGVLASGETLDSYGTHSDVAAAIVRRARDLGAGLIVVGRGHRDAALASMLGPSVTAQIAADAPCHVVVINPDAGTVGPLGTSAAAERATRAF